jgi:hypothetical protein
MATASRHSDASRATTLALIFRDCTIESATRRMSEWENDHCSGSTVSASVSLRVGSAQWRGETPETETKSGKQNMAEALLQAVSIRIRVWYATSMINQPGYRMTVSVGA